MCSPAEKASQETLKKIYTALDGGKSFRVEAGAGAGKTYSLIKALNYLIESQSTCLKRKFQKIACITYTNVASDEIKARIDNHPSVYVDTIHGFCWSFLQGFQSQLREEIPQLSDGRLLEKIEEAGGLTRQKIIYDLGYRKVTDKQIYIHHDNVVELFKNLLNREKFTGLLRSQYPIIFIDEYQDTNSELAESIIKNLIESDTDVLVGLFGDHWQKIYEDGVGKMTSKEIVEINKNANFRSEKNIVHFLNRMRPELIQHEKDSNSSGEITVYHSNNWQGLRRDGSGGGHWTGDLPESEATKYFKTVKNKLVEAGWEFSYEKTKILMLTNGVLAREQGYQSLTKVFSYPDDYLKMQDNYIDYFVNVIEPLCNNFLNRKYGEMFKSIGRNTPRLENHTDKESWHSSLSNLIEIRTTGTIGHVLEFLKESKKPRLSPKIEESEEKYGNLERLEQIQDDTDNIFFSKIQKLKKVNYSEVVELAKYIDDKTPFSTNHGVKGAEFENVLVVCGRGWNRYNWDELLTWEKDGIPKGKDEKFEKNRNLFYVSCSRPKKRLALLFTQKLSESAMHTLKNWFLPENIHSL